jgi:hypothetical protein
MGVCHSGVEFSMDSPEDGAIKLFRNLAPTLQPARPYVAEETLTKKEIQPNFPDRFAIRQSTGHTRCFWCGIRKI